MPPSHFSSLVLQICSVNFSFLLLLSILMITTLLILSSMAALFLLNLVKPYKCSCHICQSFLSSTWSRQFHNLCDWYTHLLAQSPTGTIHLHVLRNVITANPANVEHMLKTRFHVYPKGDKFSAILGDLLGRGIFNADGDLWRFQRKIASLELGSVAVKSYAMDVIAYEIGTRLIPVLSAAAVDGTLIDLQDVFRRFSFDTVCKLSFGVDPCCLDLSRPVSEFASAFDLASRLTAERAVTLSPGVWKLKRLFNLGSERKLSRAIKAVHELADEVIKHKRNLIGINSSPNNNDLLSRFMATINDDVLLRDIVVSFLLAGRDTVASALTSFFFLVTQDSQSIDSIRREADAVIGANAGNQNPSFRQLREMQYLHAAVHESLRLFPPVQFDSKFSEEEDIFPDGTLIGRGTRVTYHCYAMGRMERIWGSDCLEFKPERWLREGSFKVEDPFKFPIFQAGPRVCLGRDMAIVEVKAVAVALIRRFDIRVVDSGWALEFLPGLTASVRTGLRVSVHKRRL